MSVTREQNLSTRRGVVSMRNGVMEQWGCDGRKLSVGRWALSVGRSDGK